MSYVHYFTILPLTLKKVMYRESNNKLRRHWYVPEKGKGNFVGRLNSNAEVYCFSHFEFLANIK
jgi:hypothetical protein